MPIALYLLFISSASAATERSPIAFTTRAGIGFQLDFTRHLAEQYTALTSAHRSDDKPREMLKSLRRSTTRLPHILKNQLSTRGAARSFYALTQTRITTPPRNPVQQIITHPRTTVRSTSTMPPSQQQQPKDGAVLTATFQVQDSDLASAISPDPSDVYARVLATPRLVSFMEIVCARMLVPHLADGQLSVGVRVEMDHLAATNVGETVEVKVTFLRKEGKQFVFECVISDAGGEVGRGVCRRAIIEEKRLMDGAGKRAKGGSRL